jgi:hypothetical protein
VSLFDYWACGRPNQIGDETVVPIECTDYSANYIASIPGDVWEQIWAWCQKNCAGPYRHRIFDVAFALPEDAVLFHMQHILSDTYLPWIERK